MGTGIVGFCILAARKTGDAEIVIATGRICARYANGRGYVDRADVAMVFGAAVTASGGCILPDYTHAFLDPSIFRYIRVFRQVLRVFMGDSRVVVAGVGGGCWRGRR